ncbi:MAG: hypothetical protein ACI4DR_05900, partial [Roseburia sp.]
MRKRQLKRIVAGILALLLLVGMVPIVEWIKVEAAPSNIREMNLNIDGEIAGIENPTAPSTNTDPWRGSKVYFAQGGGTSYQWRVLSKKTTAYSSNGTTETMFLHLDGKTLGSQYANQMHNWLNGSGFLNRMQPQERTATIASSGSNLTNLKIFLPSYSEVKNTAYGYPNNNNAAASRRTNAFSVTRDPYGSGSVWTIDTTGTLGNFAVGGGAWPMLNLELAKILMTSNHTFDKTQAVREVPAYVPTDATRWKITLLDDA